MAAQTLPDIILDTLKHLVAFLDFIQSHQCHIRFWNLWFLHHMINKTILINFCYAKISRIVYLSYAQHGIRAFHHLFYIIFTDGVTKYYKHLIPVHNILGKPYGMPYPCLSTWCT